MSYISKEQAMQIAESYGTSTGVVIGRHSGVADIIADEIYKLQDADVAPVIHGEWFGTVCSACGESFSCYFDCNYCPNCGAIMDGGDGEK